MKSLTSRYGILTALAVVGPCAFVLSPGLIHAQSTDALLDKLVEKGILSTREAADLRTEADKNFQKSYQVRSGMPDWVTALKINGDFRGRYESFFSENDAFVQRTRWRYRFRLGAVAAIKDNFEVGVRLTSSESTGAFGGDPISGNTTARDNSSKKFVFVDLAYGRWRFVNNKDMSGALSIGKMENPFQLPDLMFDADYTPEGVGLNYSCSLGSDHLLKLNAGAFLLDELAGDSRDPYFYGGQVRWDGRWSRRISSSVGVALLTIVNDENLTSANVPNINGGNSRNAATAPAVNFNPVAIDFALTYTLESMPLYRGSCPIRLFGDYINNLAAEERNIGWDVGLGIGKSGKKGTWDLTYRYKYMGGDIWYEEMTDSDWGAFSQAAYPNSGLSGYVAGTNSRGHAV